MEDTRSRQPEMARELALLVLLATLWGGSYTFIKLGVATIPPINLIAARTAIAGAFAGRHHALARHPATRRCRDMAAFSVPGLSQQRYSLDADRLGRALSRRRPC